MEEQGYLDLVKKVLDHGDCRQTRNATTYSLFGERLEFDLSNGTIPRFTTKFVSFKNVFYELMFFLKGKTNVKYLQDHNVKIWNGNSSKEFLESVGLPYEEGDIGACFMENTLILTDNGYKYIQQYNQEEDMLYTHNGRFKNAQPIVRTYSGKCVELKLHNKPFNINCTEDHPVYARISKDNHFSDPLWMKASALNPKVHVIGMRINTKSVIPEFNFSDNDMVFVKKLSKRSEWLFLGYIVGTGWELKNGNIFFTIPKLFRDDLLKIFRNIFPITHHIDDIYYFNQWTYKKILLDFIDDEGNIIFPQWIHDTPYVYLKIFITGLFYIHNKLLLNKKLVYGIERICWKIGTFCIISKQWKYCTSNPDFFFIEQLDEIRMNYYIDNNFAWIPLKSRKVFEVTNEKVYNFTVEQDETYTVENITVHNCYGFQWRHHGAKYIDCNTDYTGQGFDQIEYCMNLLRNDPTSRRIMFSAWNPSDFDKMALLPCHTVFQFYVRKVGGIQYLDGQLYQRSADVMLGVPYNILSYSLLLYLVGKTLNMVPGKLVLTFGDVHIYSNHLDGVHVQLDRKPTEFPTIKIIEKRDRIEDYEYKDIIIENYEHQGSIKMDMVA